MNRLDAKPKRVSIVLPVYNGARFLRQSIESCLKQTYRDLELIVVDDGSKDDSIEIVKSYDDDRLKLVCHETNRRLPAALNTGFAHSLGLYLTWTSHDNFYAPSGIAEMVNFIEEHPQVDFVFADEYRVDERDQILQEFKAGPLEQLGEENCLGGAFLYRRTVYEKLGPYSEQVFLAEDYEYWLRASACFTLAHLERPLYYYRVHPNSLSRRFKGGAATEAALAVRRQILGRNLWKNRMVLHRAHLSAAFRLYERNSREAAARAALWGVAFDPTCFADRRVQVLLAELYLGPRGVRFLRQLKHAMGRIIGPRSSDSEL